MGAGSYVRYSSHSSYVSTAHVTATFTYLRVVVRTVGNAGYVCDYVKTYWKFIYPDAGEITERFPAKDC
ncbi:uncharacterized protein BDR25DRAFT_360683 [Lindgomyces ingoldianus]|uniref:Uncharacterized protein n=1 Tax=Lindgomyces ingoldianus TaxID=673940 RepID=A0ACB6QGT8_9PLEO|nr:uncharacterized protein BDR25DRAFT_360683 [Lindgomyces ingoldianus]KAF2465322.1 hypothetical protein BDR25DRAFT_360683 [Lindgomyces ingoldianus]